MLRNFKNAGIPSSGNRTFKKCRHGSNDGVNTITEFFDKELWQKILSKNGHADAFIAANVMCHIPYFHSIIEGIDVLLNENGMIFEEPYLGLFWKKRHMIR